MLSDFSHQILLFVECVLEKKGVLIDLFFAVLLLIEEKAVISTNIEKLSVLAPAFIYITTDLSQKRVIFDHNFAITVTVGAF